MTSINAYPHYAPSSAQHVDGDEDIHLQSPQNEHRSNVQGSPSSSDLTHLPFDPQTPHAVCHGEHFDLSSPLSSNRYSTAHTTEQMGKLNPAAIQSSSPLTAHTQKALKEEGPIPSSRSSSSGSKAHNSSIHPMCGQTSRKATSSPSADALKRKTPNAYACDFLSSDPDEEWSTLLSRKKAKARKIFSLSTKAYSS